MLGIDCCCCSMVGECAADAPCRAADVSAAAHSELLAQQLLQQVFEVFTDVMRWLTCSSSSLA